MNQYRFFFLGLLAVFMGYLPDSSQAQTSIGQTSNRQDINNTPALSSESRVFTTIPRIDVFGSSYFVNNATTVVQMNQNKLVPGTYILGPGDAFIIKIKGIVNEEHQIEVNSRGVLSFGKVQPFLVAGLSLEDAREKITNEVMEEYQNVTVETDIVDLKNIDVIVTGNAAIPGVFTLRGNSTFLDLMYMCGGPTSQGTFRNIQLTRSSVQNDGSTTEKIMTIDLYKAFLYGDHQSIMLESGDNISIPSVSNVSSIFGQVKQTARYEWNETITLQELISMSGGFMPNAAINQIEIQRGKDSNRYEFLIVDYQDPKIQMLEIQDGDYVRIPNRTESISHENVFVEIKGRVHFPGTYFMPRGSTLRSILKAAGGLKDDAFMNGVSLTRPSIATSQQNVMQKVIQETEARLNTVLAETAENAVLSDDQKLLSKAQSLRQRTMQSLGSMLYNGRVVFNPSEVDPVLHDNDVVTIPTTQNSVTVIGAVFNSGSLLYKTDWKLKDYLDSVGGTSPLADQSKMYVIKPYGFVTNTSNGEELIEDGDTIVIPFDYNLMTASYEKTE